MGRLTKAELITAIDIFNHPQSGDESDIFAAYTTARVAMKELKHYKDLEEQGRLEIFPCKKGEDAYFIIENYIHGEIGDKAELHRQIFKRPFSLYEYVKHGKRAYATKEEAEAKLKELER